ncbi:MAG: histidine--tRNA ligase, partial [Gammaproteobacteria bacterium]|nr:histidine--tRNA ligase [Gammaproteobacteria bacterium]
TETNPLRVFDCKVDTCKETVSGAPSILDYICEDCQEHFESVQGYLESSGIPFVLDHKLVRGLDYYTRTTFEIQTDRLGAQNAVTGGGRYDGLVKLLGGPDHPGTGFAMGIERLVALLDEDVEQEVRTPDLFIAALGDTAEKKAFDWVNDLRRTGIWVETEYSSKGLKAQMKRAGRLGARKVLIVGEDELASGKGILRDMEKKVQEEVELQNIVNNLKGILKESTG